MEPVRKLPEDVRSFLRSSCGISSISQCVEELVLNSVDARAKDIAVRINLNSHRIQVVDNGFGITLSNLEKIGERYCTNKLSSVEELHKSPQFQGYRGESLASIIELSAKVEICTRLKSTPDENSQDSTTYKKTFLKESHPELTDTKRRPEWGTTVTVENFQWKLPVRQKRTNQIEFNAIKEILETIWIMHNRISITLRDCVNSRLIWDGKSVETAEDALIQIVPNLKTDEIFYGKYMCSHYRLNALISRKNYTTAKYQFLCVNKRAISSKRMQNFINDNLTRLPRKCKGRFHAFILNVACDRTRFDLVVDSCKKLDVQFENWDRVERLIGKACQKFQHFLAKPFPAPGDNKEKKKIAEKTMHLSSLLGFVRSEEERDENPVEQESFEEQEKFVKSMSFSESSQEMDVDRQQEPKEQSYGFKFFNVAKIPRITSSKASKLERIDLTYSYSEALSKSKSRLNTSRFDEIQEMKMFTRDNVRKSAVAPEKSLLLEKYFDSLALKKIDSLGSDEFEPKLTSTKRKGDVKDDFIPIWKALRQSREHAIVEEDEGNFPDWQNPEEHEDSETNSQKSNQRDSDSEAEYLSSSPKFISINKVIQQRSSESRKRSEKRKSRSVSKDFVANQTAHFVAPFLESTNKQATNPFEAVSGSSRYLDPALMSMEDIMIKRTHDYTSRLLRRSKSVGEFRDSYSDLKWFKYNEDLGCFYMDGEQTKVQKKSVKKPILKKHHTTPYNITYSTVNTVIESYTSNRNSDSKHECKFKKTTRTELKERIGSNFADLAENLLHFGFSSKNYFRSTFFERRDKPNFMDCAIQCTISNESSSFPLTSIMKEMVVDPKAHKSDNSEARKISLEKFKVLANVLIQAPSEKQISPMSSIIQGTPLTPSKIQSQRNFTSTEKPEGPKYLPLPEKSVKGKEDQSVSARKPICDDLKLSSPIFHPQDLVKDDQAINLSDILLGLEMDQELELKGREDVQPEWVEKTKENGEKYFVNLRTGNISAIQPQELSPILMTKRPESLPKGFSPIMKPSPIITEAVSVNTKKKFYEAVLESCDDETDLRTVKWRRYLENTDAETFFKEIYKEHTYGKKFSLMSAHHRKKDNFQDLTFMIGWNMPKSAYFKHLKIIGQFDNKFIIAHFLKKNRLLVFDQHAVHERIRLEDLSKQYLLLNEKGIMIKYTWTSIKEETKFKLPENSRVLGLSNYSAEILEKFGLELQITSNQFIIIKKVPLCLYNKCLRESSGKRFLDVLYKHCEALFEEIMEEAKISKLKKKASSNLLRGLINSEACRGAYMFGDVLTLEQCEKLIQQLFECQKPFICAHARPTLVQLLDLQAIQKSPMKETKPNLKNLWK